MKRFASRIIVIAVFLVLAQPLHPQEGRGNQSQVVSMLAASGCDLILAYLDRALDIFHDEPSATSFIVVYPGRDSPPGKVLQHLLFAKDYITHMRGGNDARIVTGLGPVREKLTIEIWIVPDGTSPPSYTPMDSRYVLASGKYDDGGVYVLRYGRRWSLGAEICSLENVFLTGFAETLLAMPASTGCIILHPGREPGESGVHGMEQAIRRNLSQVSRLRADRIRFIIGDRRRYQHVELWVMPRGDKPPRPSR